MSFWITHSFSLKAPMLKRVCTIRSISFGKEGLKANPGLEKDGREEVMGTSEESSKTFIFQLGNRKMLRPL